MCLSENKGRTVSERKECRAGSLKKNVIALGMVIYVMTFTAVFSTAASARQVSSDGMPQNGVWETNEVNNIGPADPAEITGYNGAVQNIGGDTAGYNSADQTGAADPAGYNAADQAGAADPAGYNAADQTGAADPAGFNAADQTGAADPAGYNAADQTGAADPAGYNAADQTGTADPAGYNAADQTGAADPAEYTSPDAGDANAGLVTENGAAEAREEIAGRKDPYTGAMWAANPVMSVFSVVGCLMILDAAVVMLMKESKRKQSEQRRRRRSRKRSGTGRKDL